MENNEKTWIEPCPIKRQPRGRRGYVAAFVLEQLMQGNLSDVQIAEGARALFGGSTSPKSVQWYKSVFKAKGILEIKTSRKRRVLTKLVYELVYKQLEPPNNIEIVTSYQLVKFAQLMIKRYAKNLMQPIDELVYDVRTAKLWLEKTGRFTVIDNNDYDNPFEWVNTEENAMVENAIANAPSEEEFQEENRQEYEAKNNE